MSVAMPRSPLFWALAAAAALALAGPAGAQTITPLVVEGDVVPGVGLVTSVANFAINDNGEWIVEVDTDNADTDADGALITSTGLLLREGQALPAPVGFTLNTFDAVTLNDAGQSVWNFFLAPVGSNDSGIYFGDQLMIQEGDFSTAVGFTGPTPYTGFFETKINDSNQALLMASVDDPGVASTTDRALVVLTYDNAGNLLSETLYFKEGDSPPNQTNGAITDFETGPHGFAFNDAGQIMVAMDLDGDTASDTIVYIDTTVITQEGSPSPIVGRNWANDSTVEVDLNDLGGWVVSSLLDGDAATNAVIVSNGAKVIQEGDTTPTIGAFQLTSFGSGPVLINNANQVLWYGDWNDPDLDVDTGLFLDDQLLVQEGVTTVGANVIDTLRGISDGYTMSDDGRYIVFEAVLDNGNEGAFLLELAQGLTRIDGCFAQNPATLRYFSGSAAIGDTLGLAMDDAPTNSELAVLVVAANPAPGFPPCGIPFPGVGEVLIDIINPGALQQPMGVYTGSPLTVQFQLNNNPAIVGLSAWCQGLFINPLPPNVISLTNGLQVTFQP